MARHVYFAVFLPEAGGGYSVTFPDVPGAISEGQDFYEAFHNARDALEALLNSLIEDGEPLPTPRDPRLIMHDVEGGLISAIEAETESKTVRVNVSLDERLLAQIDRAAERSGHTRSGFFVRAVQKLLDEQGSMGRRPALTLADLNSPVAMDAHKAAEGRMVREFGGYNLLIGGTPPKAATASSGFDVDFYGSVQAGGLIFAQCKAFGAGEELQGPPSDPLSNVDESEVVTVRGNRVFKYRPIDPLAAATTASSKARRPSS